MGDYTNLNMWVPKMPAGFEAAIRGAFEYYSGGGEHYVDDEESGGLRLGANEVSCGSAEDLSHDLLNMIAGNDHEPKAPDFAFQVYEEPKYEWLGAIVLHVPGMPDYMADCDSDGNPVVNPGRLVQLVDEATSLDELRVTIRTVLGEAHFNALKEQSP